MNMNMTDLKLSDQLERELNESEFEGMHSFGDKRDVPYEQALKIMTLFIGAALLLLAIAG